MFWISKSNRHWGWIDRTPRGHHVLELSLHSRVRLARENSERIRREIDAFVSNQE